jgi:hypothetical protein
MSFYLRDRHWPEQQIPLGPCTAQYLLSPFHWHGPKGWLGDAPSTFDVAECGSGSPCEWSVKHRVGNLPYLPHGFWDSQMDCLMCHS